MSQDDDGYEDYERDYDCCHEEYEADILTGIATCDLCGHRWMQTKEEIQREIDHIAAYHHDMEDRENRRQWWRDRLWPLSQLWDAARGWFRRMRLAKTPMRSLVDDDIPF